MPGFDRSNRNEAARTAGAVLFFIITIILIGTAVVTAQEAPVVENRFRPLMRTGPQLELVAEAGVDGPEEAMLFRPRGMFFDDEDHLYIPDWGNAAVMVYDRDGIYLRRIGRKGSGPGEINSPAGSYISWNDELVIPDRQNQRISYFTLDGEFLRSEVMASSNGIYIVGPSNVPTIEGEYIRAGRGTAGIIITSSSGISTSSSGPKEQPGLVEIVDEEGEVIRSFGERYVHDDSNVAGLLNQVCLAWLPPDRIAVAHSFTNEIRIYNHTSGEIEMIITRDTAFRPQEPKMEMSRNTSPDGQSVRIGLSRHADEITVDIACDPEGRLWVITRILDQDATGTADENEEWDGMTRLEIFSSEGELLAALPHDGRVKDIEFDAAGDLWMLEAVESNTARRYRVIWR
ncbi:6-bladed beta-propeller [Candidatus Zixiibacteriota bacterium]